MQAIRIQRQYRALIKAAVRVNNTRHTMDGALVGDRELLATDGRKLVCVPWDSAEGEWRSRPNPDDGADEPTQSLVGSILDRHALTAISKCRGDSIVVHDRFGVLIFDMSAKNPWQYPAIGGLLVGEFPQYKAILEPLLTRTPAVTIGLSAKYLQDCIDALGSGVVTLTIYDDVTPIMVRPAGDNDRRGQAILMPISIKD